MILRLNSNELIYSLLSLFRFCSGKQNRDSNKSRVFREYNGSYTQVICISMRIFRKQKTLEKKGVCFNKDWEYNSDGTSKSNK